MSALLAALAARGPRREGYSSNDAASSSSSPRHSPHSSPKPKSSPRAKGSLRSSLRNSPRDSPQPSSGSQRLPLRPEVTSAPPVIEQHRQSATSSQHSVGRRQTVARSVSPGSHHSAGRPHGSHQTVEGGSNYSGMGGPAGGRDAKQAEDFTKRRLFSFLALHFLAFGAEVAAMVNFLYTRDHFFFAGILLPFLFSGLFCAHAAWHCSVPSLMWNWGLPLKNWPMPIAWLLSLPFGIGQGVIILLAFEEYASRTTPDHGEFPKAERTNKFHCKAVNGMFEGFLSCAVLLYAYWSLDFPKDNPITHSHWHLEKWFLAGVGMIAFLQAGVGLMELDFCISRTISKRMHQSVWYEFMHWVFRVCEVTSRVSIFIAFMVQTRQRLIWWWVPLAVEFIVTIILVAIYGGAENTWFVRILCSIPCSFANVFLFIDAPYKRRAAAHLSRCLTIKNGLEMIVLPTMYLILVYTDGGLYIDDIEQWWNMHPQTNVVAAITIPLYWILLVWIHTSKFHRSNIVDIFSACESGSEEQVLKAMRYLTRSAAIGLNINCFDIEGRTPLMFAALRGHANICRLLLKEGARVDVRMFSVSGGRALFYLSVKRQWTALHMAAWKGHAEVVRTLLEAGASGAQQNQEEDAYLDSYAETPLHVAVWSGHEQSARYLAARHPQWIDALNHRGRTPLQLARTEAMREAICAPTAGGDDGGRAALLLQQMALAQDEAGRSTEEAWPQVQLAISRSTDDLSAPGLCSYIASSCGGALGKAFLATRGPNSPPELVGGRLPTISDFNLSVRSAQGTQAAAEPGTPQSAPPPDGQEVPAAPPPTFPMQDLEPISAEGAPVTPTFLQPYGGIDPLDLELACPCCSCCFSQQGRQRSIQMSEDQWCERLFYVPNEAVLGEGAYGLVWRAMNTGTGTWYAVKNIKTSRRGAEAIATRECLIADRVRFQPHPCLVNLFHVKHFVDAGLYCLVLEFCPGGDLLHVMQAIKHRAFRERLSYKAPEQVPLWLAQVFLGLEHMHLRMDTLLRDLKPENCVITAGGQVKLTDFGFGRFGIESSGQWSFGIPTGSPGYVAPEILQREGYDYSVDLYSLGVLGWVLLTGGLKNSGDPFPPLGEAKHRNDFTAHYNDWLLLAECISAPDMNDALPLPEVQRDFVARLTQHKPSNRLRHRDIRLHDFMQPLSLPNFDARSKDVEAWLASKPAAGMDVLDYI